MRIGIYSGTFDPIHEGHVLFAQVSAEQFGLDKILLIPEAEPRQKTDITAIDHRMRMSELATVSNPSDIQVVGFEDLPQHTIHGVISRVYNTYPEDEYFLLMGSDVFRNIGKWGSREDEDGSVNDIAGSVGFIVGINSLSELAELEEIARQLSLTAQFVEPPLMPMSSSKIRKKLATSQLAHGLHDDVARYIDFEKLYRG